MKKRGAISILSIAILQESVTLEDYKRSLLAAQMKGAEKTLTDFIENAIEEQKYTIESLCKARDTLYIEAFFKPEVDEIKKL